MRWVYLIILLLVVTVLVIFAVQNRQLVPVRFLTWSIEMPRSLLLAGVYVLGMLSGWTVVGALRRSLSQVRGSSTGDRKGPVQ